MIKKRTLTTKTVDEFDGTSAKVYLISRIREETEDGDYVIGLRYCYLTDENDPETEVDLRKQETINLSVSEMDTKESSLGPFTGTNYTDKTNDMLLKIINDHLDTNTPYATAASGWENI